MIYQKVIKESMRKYLLLILAVAAMVVSSCGSYKRTAYLQDMKANERYPVSTENMVVVRSGDKLSIVVSGSSPALAAPFNLVRPMPTYDPASGESRYSVKDTEDGPQYLVDQNGNIEFPILGDVHVGGMSLTQVKDEITMRIQERNLLREPIVQVSFVNFQITMLGEIGAGNFVINEPGVNIFQAIAMAGDLSDNANRKDIMVVRTEGNERIVYSLDITSKKIYDSPAFYLRQNDMVYVKPDKTKLDSKAENIYRFFTMSVSTLSMLSTFALLFKVYGN